MSNALQDASPVFPPKLLDACISCGLCLPSCPTFLETGREQSSPRGRIHLMRRLATGAVAFDDPLSQKESSFCLGCRACEPVCSAGVQYGSLLERWRDQAWTSPPRTLRLLLWGVARRWRVRLLGLFSLHARRRRGRGAGSLMLGCFERAIFPRVSRSAARLAPELSVSPSAGCCGALHAHNGEREAGEAMALEVGRRLPGTIVTTSGGCAAHLATVLGRDRVRELSEWLLEREPETERASAGGAGSEPGASRARPRIALQDSCHLRNGLGVHEQPRQLIEEVGEYVELEGAERCCGGAGTYWLLEPDQSAIMLEDALDRIEAADIDIVATVNPGCLRQLGKGLKRRGSRTRAVHLAELL